MSKHLDRWFAGRRVYDAGHRPRNYTVRLAGQPEDGFETVGGVMDWLKERGLLVEVPHPEGMTYESGRGWGDPYCAVAGSRGDPWEKPPAGQG